MTTQRPAKDYGHLSRLAREHDMSPQGILARERVAAGLCARCGRKRKGAGATAWDCGPCAEYANSHHAQRAAARMAEGRCTHCGQPSDGCRRCATCRERENERRRKPGAKRGRPRRIGA